jgi:hypothetical protein
MPKIGANETSCDIAELRGLLLWPLQDVGKRFEVSVRISTEATDLRHFEQAPGLYPRSAASAIGVTDCPSCAEAAKGLTQLNSGWVKVGAVMQECV